jgi:hypothetical protein
MTKKELRNPQIISKRIGRSQVALDTFTNSFMEIVLNAALSAIP